MPFQNNEGWEREEYKPLWTKLTLNLAVTY